MLASQSVAPNVSLTPPTVLPTAYLPPIAWFAQLADGGEVFVEQHENFQKQTLRNRCTIDSPNGSLHLSVPVERSTFVDGKCLTKDVRISAHSDWQRQHWHALSTTYLNSPFFEYLQDDFRPVYEKRWIFLIDLNEELANICCDLMDLHPVFQRTLSYRGVTFAPSAFQARPYYQVFQHKHGFLPNLSIVDLLFNMGRESEMYL